MGGGAQQMGSIPRALLRRAHGLVFRCAAVAARARKREGGGRRAFNLNLLYGASYAYYLTN